MTYSAEGRCYRIETAEEIYAAINHVDKGLYPMTKSLKNTVFTMVNAVRDRLTFDYPTDLNTLVERLARMI
jgi:hypothetical protein